MSDVLTIEEVNTIKDEKIIHGYVRSNYVNPNNHIPKDIVDVLFVFYHVIKRETFKHYNAKNYKLSNDGMTMSKKKGSCDSVCYGSICISSIDGGMYSWTFKIRKRTAVTAIGIEETTYIQKDDGHFNDWCNNTKFYALRNDGDRNK